jgi:hypothetical protein
LVNTLATAGSQTTTTLTSRTAPVTGNVVAVLANVATDITSVTTRRGYATSSGTTSSTFSGSISKTTPTGTPGSTGSWSTGFLSTIFFPSADQARYFYNAGGRVYLTMNKSSTGTDNDADWNTFIGKVGTLSVTGIAASKTLGGVAYTGTTRTGGTGGTQTTLSTATGWYALTAGAAATTIFQLNDTVSPYTSDTVIVTAAKNAGATTLTLVTTWNSNSRAGAGQSTNISGGTDTASPYTVFGTAPAVLVRFVPPSTTDLSNSWGTPTIAAPAA